MHICVCVCALFCARFSCLRVHANVKTCETFVLSRVRVVVTKFDGECAKLRGCTGGRESRARQCRTNAARSTSCNDNGGGWARAQVAGCDEGARGNGRRQAGVECARTPTAACLCLPPCDLVGSRGLREREEGGVRGILRECTNRLA